MMRKIALCIGLFASLGWSSGASAVPITNGLVAGYEFNGNANDVSGNGNDGVVNGALLTTDRFGNAGSAYSFDGVNDYIDLGNQNFGTSVSVSLWVNADQVGPYPQALIGKFDGSAGTSTEQTFSLIIHYQEPPVFNEFEWQVSESGLDLSSEISSTRAVPNDWYHVVGTYDSGEAKIFVDGVEEASWNTGFGSLYNSDVHLVLGMFTHDYPVVGGLPFDGRLDDVYIYDRALSPTEVSTLYSVIPEPNTALLLGFGLVGLGIKTRRIRGASHSGDGRASS